VPGSNAADETGGRGNCEVDLVFIAEFSIPHHAVSFPEYD
jgi:hypothetical protein